MMLVGPFKGISDKKSVSPRLGVRAEFGHPIDPGRLPNPPFDFFPRRDTF